MAEIPDITETEDWILKSTLKKRDRGYQQSGTGVHEYDDLSECIVSLLQARADYTAKERGDIDAK